MPKLLVYYAHPGQSHSHVNARMARVAEREDGVSFVDLYADYPRFEIDIDNEQQRLIDHEVILFQFPVFWYSTPSIIKEWLDLVLEQGFAYGDEGDKLAGKTLMLALTAAGPAEAYTTDGYQNHTLRTFLSPLEQSTTLCKMHFATPYVLFGALHAPDNGEAELHINAYQQLIRALRDNTYDFEAAVKLETVAHTDIANLGGKANG